MNNLQVFDCMQYRMKEGVKKYGDFNPATDARDFKKEIESELIDVLNYLNMYKAQVAMQATIHGFNYNENDFNNLDSLRDSIMNYFERQEL